MSEHCELRYIARKHILKNGEGGDCNCGIDEADQHGRIERIVWTLSRAVLAEFGGLYLQGFIFASRTEKVTLAVLVSGRDIRKFPLIAAQH
jgi:hypothetical protein